MVHGVDPVDLERGVHRCPFDDVARPRAEREPRPTGGLDESKVHRQDDGKVVDHHRDAPDLVSTQESQAVLVRQLLEPCVFHSTFPCRDHASLRLHVS